MENEIYDILNSYKEAIDVILGRCDELVNANQALEERINKLESMLFDEILEPARLALEEDDRNRRFDEFNGKYGEKLSAFDKVLGAAEGNPDFSMARRAFLSTLPLTFKGILSRFIIDEGTMYSGFVSSI